MFNSPLHYCAKCKHYVELDQSKAECAAQHGCEGSDCPMVGVFRSPGAQGKEEPQPSPKPVSDSKSNT